MSEQQLHRVREICLALPATSERLSHGEPTFFVGKKVFTMFANNHHQDGHIAVWIPVPAGAQTMLIDAAPEKFFKPPYVGVRGWVGIELAAISTAELVHHLQTAWRLIAPKRVRSALINQMNPQEEMMQPEFVTKPAFTVVGKQIHTQAKSPEIPALWMSYGPTMGTLAHLAEPWVSYGMMHHFDEATCELDYLAGEAVTHTGQLPTDLTQWEVPANTYAVFETTLTTIAQTFDYINNTWLPTSGYTQTADPYFERYGETFNPHDPNAKLSIYIPVEIPAEKKVE